MARTVKLLALCALMLAGFLASIGPSVDARSLKGFFVEEQGVEVGKHATKLTDDKDDYLALHNGYRIGYHHAEKELTVNQDLVNSAAVWAAHLAETCDFTHSEAEYKGSPLGENLAAGYRSWEAAVWGWYEEYKQYDYNNPGFTSATGHFTQLVWLATTEIGCAKVEAPSCHGTYYVCQYYLPGNFGFKDDYAKNVLPPPVSGATPPADGGDPEAPTDEPTNTPTDGTDTPSKPAWSLEVKGDDPLALHNAYRKVHGAPEMTTASDLEDAALAWGQKMADLCQFDHSKDRPDDVGENLAAGYDTWSKAIWGWYAEGPDYYDFEQPGFTSETGHFTQVVWIASTELGCASVEAPNCDMSVYYVCQYRTAGNSGGPDDYTANVLLPQSA